MERSNQPASRDDLPTHVKVPLAVNEALGQALALKHVDGQDRRGRHKGRDSKRSMHRHLLSRGVISRWREMGGEGSRKERAGFQSSDVPQQSPGDSAGPTAIFVIIDKGPVPGRSGAAPCVGVFGENHQHSRSPR